METRGFQGAGSKLTLGAINLILSALFTPKQKKKTMEIHSSFNHASLIDLFLLKGAILMVE